MRKIIDHLQHPLSYDTCLWLRKIFFKDLIGNNFREESNDQRIKKHGNKAPHFHNPHSSPNPKELTKPPK
jgi:hypothetical protein